MRAFVQQVRPWAGPVLAYSLLALVMIAIGAHPAWADGGDIIATAQDKVQKAIKVGGYVMVIGGLVVGIKSGLKVSDGQGGWAGLAVAVLLLVMGFKVAKGGEDGVGTLIGS